MVFTIGQVIGARSLVVGAAAVILVVVINVKARWEERLVERFADYQAYALRTPRFSPTFATLLRS